MVSELFESIIRTSGADTDDFYEEPDDFFEQSAEIPLHEFRFTASELKRIFEQVLQEAENPANTSLPAITIEVNAEENNYFSAIKNAKTGDEKNTLIEKLRNYYRTFFTQNYKNKSATNQSSGIKVELVRTGIDHSLRQIKNCNLWPAIRYLPSIIKIASYTPETSQHIDDPNTNRGKIAHIFNCKADFIFRSETKETKETHTLRISAVTFKQGSQNNFRHITENENIITARLVSIEIQ